MARKLKIDMDLCSACKLCKSVCIRDNIEIDEFAYELESNCFDCGHCMAVCPQGAITLLKYENQLDRVEEYDSRQIPIDYDDLLQFLKQRRSVRWFKKKKIDEKTFNKLFEGAYYSPSAQNNQDVEFVVLDEKLDEFMDLVYDIIKAEENEFFRIKEFGDYLKDKSSKKYHPSRLELLAYSLGLGGFYSLFILKSDEINHDKLMEFFPNIDKSKHLYSSFIIGYPKKRFRRTVPHEEINVSYM